MRAGVWFVKYTIAQWWDDDDAQELRDTIRALTPADATTALDRIKRQARAEGLRMAAQIAVDFDGGDVSNPWEWPNRIAAAILAAAEQEGQGERRFWRSAFPARQKSSPAPQFPLAHRPNMP